MNYKIPMIEKLYEAYSAIADNRVKFDGNFVYVDSSNHAKTYTIEKSNDTFVSNDNMSFFKQTIGYPILAILMLEGKLNYNKYILEYFKNIDWKKINTEYHNDYTKATQYILNQMKLKGIDVDFIVKETENTYEAVKQIKMPYIKSKIKLIQ